MKVVFNWLYPMNRRPPPAQELYVDDGGGIEADLAPLSLYEDTYLDELLVQDIGEKIEGGNRSGSHSYCESPPAGIESTIGELQWTVVGDDVYEHKLLHGDTPVGNPAERMNTDMALVAIQVAGGIVLVLLDTRDPLMLRTCKLGNAVYGYMWLDDPTQIQDGYANPTYRQVLQSAARKGYGPLLYEAAMGYVKREDDDRYVVLGAEVSTRARRVWKKMSYRNDVWRYELAKRHDELLWLTTLRQLPKGLRAMYQHQRRPRWLHTALTRGLLFVRNYARRCGVTHDQARDRINTAGNRFFKSVYTGR